MDGLIYYIAYTSLLLTPLPNVNSYQIPGYDNKGGPWHHRLDPSLPVKMDVLTKNKYYTCYEGVWINMPVPCNFHNSFITSRAKIIYLAN